MTTLTCRTTRHPLTLRRGRFALGEVLGAAADVATLCGEAGVASLDGALFLDTETTGLGGGAGTHVFLLGVAQFDGDALEVRQWVLPDPAEEDAFLDALDAEAARARVLVTFHGAGFDLPRLEERCLLAGRRFPLAGLPHVDLLRGARRVLRLRAGRLRLQHLERAVLGIERLDDLPGAECPAAWFAFLKGDRAPMERVLDHNLDDLLSLPALGAALAAAARGEAPAPDLHSAGRVLARAGHEDRALGLQRGAARAADDGGLAALAHWEAARLLRRQGLTAEAAAEALSATLADPGLPGPWLDLAKHAEHGTRDLAFALACARRAERCLFLRSRSVAARRDVAKRIARLGTKLGTAPQALGATSVTQDAAARA
jgi:uncharacterized protein